MLIIQRKKGKKRLGLTPKDLLIFSWVLVWEDSITMSVGEVGPFIERAQRPLQNEADIELWWSAVLGSIPVIFFLPPQKAYWICPPVQAVDHCRFPSVFAYQTKAASLPFVMHTHCSGQGHLSDCKNSTWGKKKENNSSLKLLMAAFPHTNAKACSVPACRWQQVCGTHPSTQREAEGQAKQWSHQLQLLQMLSLGFISLHWRWLHVKMHLKYGWFTTFLLMETCLFSKTGNTEALQPKPVVFQSCSPTTMPHESKSQSILCCQCSLGDGSPGGPPLCIHM